jgi:hypothetical protein
LQLLSLLNLAHFWLTKETPIGLAISLMVGVVCYTLGSLVAKVLAKG